MECGDGRKIARGKSRIGNITGLRCFLGGRPGGAREEERERQREKRKRGNEKILIRNVKNKIIRLPDSKCQLGEGSRWREEERVRQREWKEGRGERKYSDETGRVGVIETMPHHCSHPQRANTIFLMLRRTTSPRKISPISHSRETDLPGQPGESSYESVYARAYICVLLH